MKCRVCGTELLESDRFCIKCGAVVESKIKNCIFCGAELRKGENFCHRCGAEVPVNTSGRGNAPSQSNSMSTTEIDFLSDAVIAATEAQMGRKKEEKTEAEDLPHIVPRDKEWQENRQVHQEKRKRVSRSEEYDEPYEDEEEEENGDFLSKLMVVLSIVIGIVIVVALVIALKETGLIKVGSLGQPKSVQEETVEAEGELDVKSELGTLKIVKNVNIRDGASTEGTNILGVAKAGESYSYYEVKNDKWYLIDADGVQGYVYKDYVKVEE